MGNVTALPGVSQPAQQGEPNEALIRSLTHALERAKSGELQVFCGTGLTVNGMRFSLHTTRDGINAYAMYGAIQMLGVEFLQRYPSMMA